ARGKMKVRQPLAALYVASTLELNPELQDIIKEEVNVKELVITNNLPAGEAYIASKEDANVQAALDIALTPQLKAEGVARDIIRTGQTSRREAQYGLDDRITLIISSEDAGLMEIVGQQKEII